MNYNCKSCWELCYVPQYSMIRIQFESRSACYCLGYLIIFYRYEVHLQFSFHFARRQRFRLVEIGTNPSAFFAMILNHLSLCVLLETNWRTYFSYFWRICGISDIGLTCYIDQPLKFCICQNLNLGWERKNLVVFT